MIAESNTFFNSGRDEVDEEEKVPVNLEPAYIR